MFRDTFSVLKKILFRVVERCNYVLSPYGQIEIPPNVSLTKISSVQILIA